MIITDKGSRGAAYAAAKKGEKKNLYGIIKGLILNLI